MAFRTHTPAGARKLALTTALAAVALISVPASPPGPVGEHRAQAADAAAGAVVAGARAAAAGERRAARSVRAKRATARNRTESRRARRAGGRRLAARFALGGPRGTKVLRNRRYGPFGPTLDVYRRAANPAPAPAVLLVHGGGWGGGGKQRMAPVAKAVARAGMVAVNVGYSLAAPGWAGYPRQPDELAAALRWVRRHADRLGVDAHRIGAFGSSAGGHLAALLATRGPSGRFAEAGLGAAVLWSAPLDLPALSGHRLLGPAAENLIGCGMDACPERWVEASPLAHASPGDAPLLLVNSRREMVPLAQAEAMAARLAAAAVPHDLLVLDGHAHGRDYAPRVLGRSVAFLRDWLLR